MGRERKFYDTTAWRRVRKYVLARDGYMCQLRCSKNCKGTANSADHIRRPEDGGAIFDPQNLQAACVSCNTAKRNQQAAHRSRSWERAKGNPLQQW